MGELQIRTFQQASNLCRSNVLVQERSRVISSEHRGTKKKDRQNKHIQYYLQGSNVGAQTEQMVHHPLTRCQHDFPNHDLKY